MLQLWSSDILEIWTEVYALAIARKTSTIGSMDLDECKQTVLKMAERNQAMKVRVKSANLLGFLAKYNSLGSPELYKKSFLGKARIVAGVC